MLDQPASMTESRLLSDGEPAFWADVQALQKLLTAGVPWGTASMEPASSDTGDPWSAAATEASSAQPAPGVDSPVSGPPTVELPTPDALLKSREKVPVPTPQTAPRPTRSAAKRKDAGSSTRPSPYAQSPKFDHLPLDEEQGLRLSRVIGFSESTGAAWIRSPPQWESIEAASAAELVVFPCDKMLIAQTLQSGDGSSIAANSMQQVFRGHAAPISILKANEDHTVLLTAQATDGLCFLWGQSPRNDSSSSPSRLRKICQWTPHANGLDCAAFSSGTEMVVTAGLDGNRRSQIIVWGVQGLISAAKVHQPANASKAILL
eukprot:scaffold1459_cov260-Pinguiococcus_pyrenoidosus.AAC.20